MKLRRLRNRRSSVISLDSTSSGFFLISTAFQTSVVPDSTAATPKYAHARDAGFVAHARTEKLPAQFFRVGGATRGRSDASGHESGLSDFPVAARQLSTATAELSSHGHEP